MCLSLCYAGGREIRHKILMSRSMPSNLVGNTKITISIGWNCWRTPNDMAWYVAPSRVPSLSWVLTMSQVSHPLHPWRLSPMWYFISTFIHRWGNRDLESLSNLSNGYWGSQSLSVCFTNTGSCGRSVLPSSSAKADGLLEYGSLHSELHKVGFSSHSYPWAELIMRQYQQVAVRNRTE